MAITQSGRFGVFLLLSFAASSRSCTDSEVARVTRTKFLSGSFGSSGASPSITGQAEEWVFSGQVHNLTDTIVDSLWTERVQASAAKVRAQSRRGIAVLLHGDARTFFEPRVFNRHTERVLRPLKLLFGSDVVLFSALR